MASVCNPSTGTAATETVAVTSSIPCCPSALFTVFHKVHTLWRCFRRTSDMTANAGSFGGFIGGCLLNFACGNNPCVTVPARFVAITRRLVDCVKEYNKFAKSCGKIWNAFTDCCSKETPKRVTFKSCSWCSPSSRNCLASCLNKIIDRIVRIVKSLFMFFVHLFKLSMRYMDLMDAFSGSLQSQQESVQDFFVNCGSLLEELHEHEDQVHEVLSYIGAEYQITPLTDCASLGVCVTATTCGVASHAASKTVEFFQWCWKGCTEGEPSPNNEKQEIFPFAAPSSKLPPSIAGRKLNMLNPPEESESETLLP